jgi:hypothetical protein
MALSKEEYKTYDSEYILSRRAKGEDISDFEHTLIEEVLKERGEYCPSKPSKRVEINDLQEPSQIRAQEKFWANIGILCALIGASFGKALANTWFGIVLLFAALIYWAYVFLNKSQNTEEEKNQEIAKTEGMTELMQCCANGDITRAQDLINFGAKINSKTLSGNTALMYAARNGHDEIVALLLKNQAEPEIKNNRNQSALSIAEKLGHAKVADALRQG